MEIYFAGQGGRIKIGISSNVKARLAQLRREKPGHPISLIASVAGNLALEKALHKKLRPYRISGEWYRDCLPVQAAIQNSINNFPAPERRQRRISPFGLACKAVWPVKTAEKLAAASGQSIRACAYELAGDREVSGRSLAALVAAVARWPL